MEFLTLYRWNQYISCQEAYFTPAMRELMDRIDEVLLTAPKALKRGKSSTVVRVTIDGRECVLKRANTRHAVHFFRRLFQSSRASRNWIFSQKLRAVNIPTFEPIAIMEKRWGPLRRQSYFICNFLEGKDLFQSFEKGALPRSLWTEVANKVINIILILAHEGYYHRDLNLSNFILIDNKPHLIDLDSMSQYKQNYVTHALLKKKLWARFMENVEDTVGKHSPIVSLFQQLFKEATDT